MKRIWFRDVGSSFSKRYIYFCPSRRKALGVSHRTSIPCPSWLAWMVEFDNATVLGMAASAGFRENEFFGNRLAYTLHLEKPKGR